MKHLTFTVTNDLNYDQRMQRIGSTLVNEGYDVCLIGRKSKKSPPLTEQIFKQIRLHCFFESGKMMYVEFNLRLFFYLLFSTSDCFIAIDLDTILPNYLASVLRRKRRVYDAHELFTEQKEIITRPVIYSIWLAVERFAVPKFIHGYTVNEFIKNEFKKRYKVDYSVVKNLPALSTIVSIPDEDDRFIIYQGAVNEGRSFETLVPAMQWVNARLVICGDGNFMSQVRKLIAQYHLEKKVELKGMVSPSELAQLTPKATAAIMLFENTGLNQYQSLANRFFDYIMAGVPQICVNYPQYKSINDQYEVASLINDITPAAIADALNNLLVNNVLRKKLQQNCLVAREELNWEKEQQVLIDFYKQLFL